MSYILILPQCHMYIVCFIIWHHKLQNVTSLFLCKQILSDDHWNIVGFFLKDVILYWFNMRCSIVGIEWLCRCYGWFLFIWKWLKLRVKLKLKYMPGSLIFVLNQNTGMWEEFMCHLFKVHEFIYKLKFCLWFNGGMTMCQLLLYLVMLMNWNLMIMNWG